MLVEEVASSYHITLRISIRFDAKDRLLSNTEGRKKAISFLKTVDRVIDMC